MCIYLDSTTYTKSARGMCHPIFHGLLLLVNIVVLLIEQFAMKADKLNGIAHSSWKFNIFSLTRKKNEKKSLFIWL